jgi:replicative superfamily II helicase
MFRERSEIMLKYTKAQAKLNEFGIDKEIYPNFPEEDNPSFLAYSTIAILSDYCEQYVMGIADSENIFYNDLLKCAQYFDALKKTIYWQDNSSILSLIASITYFLSDDFGSSKSIIKSINKNDLYNEKNNILAYTYFLISKIININNELVLDEQGMYVNSINNINILFKMDEQEFNENIKQHLESIEKLTFKTNDIYGNLFVGVIHAIILKFYDNSAIRLLPMFSGLDVTSWMDNYLTNNDSIKMIWPAQKLIFEKGALQGENLIIQLPTGVGKTKSIEIIIRSSVIRQGNHKTIVLAPYRSLCNEISNDLKNAFKNNINVSLVSDVIQQDINTIESSDEVLVLTPEKLSYILKHDEIFLDDCKLFIVDEAHLFDSPSRGIPYELLLSKAKNLLPEDSQKILISAVISNSQNILDWFFNSNGNIVSSETIKTTEKSIGFIDWASALGQVHYLNTENMSNDDYFIPRVIESKSISNRNYKFPKKNQPNQIALELAFNLCHNGSSAIFLGNTRSFKPLLEEIIKINGFDYLGVEKLKSETILAESVKISNLIKLHYGENLYYNASKLGAFIHYGDLENGIRLSIEDALKKKYIKLVISTSTLAEGVNIPIKYLIVPSFWSNGKLLKTRLFQNLLGRTARSGVHSEGSLLHTNPKTYQLKKLRNNKKWNSVKSMFDPQNIEPCYSSIHLLFEDIDIGWDYIPFDGIKNFNNLLKVYSEDRDIKEYITWLNDKVNDDRFDSSYILNEEFNLIKQIESFYIKELSGINLDSNDVSELANELFSKTYAYQTLESDQKNLMIELFKEIINKIKDIDEDKRVYYSKSLIDIKQTSIIDNIKIFTSINSSNLKYNSLKYDDQFNILYGWINENSYVDIKSEYNGNNPDATLDIKDFEKICNNNISFTGSLYMGIMIDLIDQYEVSEEVINYLLILQKKIKYGLKTLMQIDLYEIGIADRELVRITERAIPNYENYSGNIKDIVRLNKENILQVIKDYPNYFSNIINRI